MASIPQTPSSATPPAVATTTSTPATPTLPGSLISTHRRGSCATIDIKIGRSVDPEISEPSNGDDNTTHPNTHSRLANSMNPEIYRAATTGDIDALVKATEDTEISLLAQATPQENTILHLASSLGHAHLVEFILARCPDLFIKENSTGELALHLAASAGHLSTVESLIQNAPERVLNKENGEGDTALHLAVKKRQKEVALFLVSNDAIVSTTCVNREGKTPLYMAAEAGWLEVVNAMVETEVYIGDVISQSVVHAAITGRNRDILDKILRSDSRLIDSVDTKGRTPLSYAASIGYLEGVHYLLDKFTLQLYTSDENGSFPIHIASAKGHIDIIQEFLWRCPDTIELLNAPGQNIFHVAAMSGRFKVVSYMLKTHEFERLINERDYKGNTPLHLATIHWHPEVVNALTWDYRVNLELVNNKGLTALDAAEENIGSMISFRKRLTWKALQSAGAPRAHHRSRTRVNTQTSTPNEPPTMENYKDRVNTLLLVSTLVATVTFAAGFTMPGGYNNSDPYQGMATLVKKRAFQAFLICNTTAMYSSIIVAVSLIWAQLGDVTLVLNALRLALPLLGVSLATMSVAFMAGVYLVVSNLNWLANVVLVMGSIFLTTFLLLFIPLYLPNSYNFRVTRYIFYYPFCLLILATKSDSIDDDQEE